MESEGNLVSSNKCEDSRKTSEVNSYKKFPHEKKSNVRIFLLFFGMQYVIENVSEC